MQNFRDLRQLIEELILLIIAIGGLITIVAVIVWLVRGTILALFA